MFKLIGINETNIERLRTDLAFDTFNPGVHFD